MSLVSKIKQVRAASRPAPAQHCLLPGAWEPTEELVTFQMPPTPWPSGYSCVCVWEAQRLVSVLLVRGVGDLSAQASGTLFLLRKEVLFGSLSGL